MTSQFVALQFSLNYNIVKSLFEHVRHLFIDMINLNHMHTEKHNTCLFAKPAESYHTTLGCGLIRSQSKQGQARSAHLNEWHSEERQCFLVIKEVGVFHLETFQKAWKGAKRDIATGCHFLSKSQTPKSFTLTLIKAHVSFARAGRCELGHPRANSQSLFHTTSICRQSAVSASTVPFINASPQLSELCVNIAICSK